jgi:thymidylate synthase
MNWSKKTIWDANYQEQAVDLGYVNGEMGDIYGVQWRNFGKETLVLEDESCKVTTYDEFPISGVDQVRLVINEAKKNPGSRRLIVNAWNPKVIWGYNDDYVTVKQAALPPCHMMFQLRITNGELDLLWYQRSVDTFLGLPFNIASYGLLLHIFARILNLKPRKLVATLGDTHIYSNHVDQVKEQLTRKEFPAPELWINPDLQTLEDFEKASVDDFKLIGYEHHQAIKAEMAV